MTAESPDHASTRAGVDRHNAAFAVRADQRLRVRIGTLSQQTAAHLSEIAVAADPEERLGTKEELRLRCGVSVATFNEALRLVQERRLIRVRPGPGGGLFAVRQPPMVRLGFSFLSLDDGATTVIEAIRIRDVLDPLLVEDALEHASRRDFAEMRRELRRMRNAATASDVTAFVRANWALHERIAATSPNIVLRSIYNGLLEVIASHTLEVKPDGHHPLPEYVLSRYQLHVDLVAAIEAGDRTRALRLIHQHDNTAMNDSVDPVVRSGVQ